jgi:hypothetical protein
MATTYELIAAVTVGAGGASIIDFNSIPNTFTDLCLKISARSTRSTTTESLFLKLNGSTLYGSERRIYAYATTASSDSFSSVGGIDISPANGNSATASTFSSGEVYIPNYAASINHPVSFDMIAEHNASSGNFMALGAGLWSNATPITSITLACDVGTFMQNSTAYLYGVKNA